MLYIKQQKERTFMKKLYTITVLVLLFTLLMVYTGFSGEIIDRIQERGYIVVGTSADQPPLTMRNKTGELFGLDLDLANFIAAGMGVKLGVEVMPFSELLQALESGKIDMIISGMTMIPERNMKVAFVGPYFVTGKGILTKNENLERTKSIALLNNPEITILALEASTSQKFVERHMPKAKLNAAGSIDTAVRALLDDKADAVIADFHSCAIYAIRYKDSGLVAGASPLSFEALGIALPPQDTLFINWTRNFLMNLQGSGDLRTLTDLWFKDPSWMNELP
jgi:polar amino acid transport system substrate-binding protein